MVQEDKLSSVLADFAQTMLTDFPIQNILNTLVERMVDVLAVTGAGVTLISPGLDPRYVAASNGDALRFEQLQTELGEGPCLVAYETGQPVSVPDLGADGQFPKFGPAAYEAGMRAVFTFPLRHGDERRLGALDLYRDRVGPLDEQEMAAAQVLADVAAAYLINAQARQQAQDVSDRFRVSSLHDALTGLPNRLLLGQRLEHLALRAQRSHATAAVLFVDLDKFKRVNDTFGHAVGDQLLVAVGQRLKAVLRPGDTLARVAGDEFVILCEDLVQVDDAETLAARIQTDLLTPFALEGVSLSITASVGIAYTGPGQTITAQLLNDADTAMYQAKHRGGGVHQVIDLREAKEAADRDYLEAELRRAQSRGELDLAYQPIVRTSDGLLVGVEALLRWTHPHQGPVPALTTVSLAEQSDLISQIGGWVLERACQDRMSWLEQHPERPLELSVNVSPRQLMALGFVDGVQAVLQDTGMDPHALVLELTEGAYLDDPDRARVVLQDLRELGVRLALDDFGTGYCSLVYLRQFPIDIIKIDQSFVSDLRDDPVTAQIASAVTELAHVLGMTVTAEGVEVLRHHQEVLELGCERSQGHWFAEPMSTARIDAELAADPVGPLLLPRAAEPELVSAAAGDPLT
jgi:diguanylate cyclase (GGDEF)-like protein